MGGGGCKCIWEVAFAGRFRIAMWCNRFMYLVTIQNATCTTTYIHARRLASKLGESFSGPDGLYSEDVELNARRPPLVEHDCAASRFVLKREGLRKPKISSVAPFYTVLVDKEGERGGGGKRFDIPTMVPLLFHLFQRARGEHK